MAAKDYANTRYSSLDQISTGNICESETGVVFLHRRREWARGGISPRCWRHRCMWSRPSPTSYMSLDLKKGGTLKWTYDPQGIQCREKVSRVAMW